MPLSEMDRKLRAVNCNYDAQMFRSLVINCAGALNLIRQRSCCDGITREMIDMVYAEQEHAKKMPASREDGLV